MTAPQTTRVTQADRDAAADFWLQLDSDVSAYDRQFAEAIAAGRMDKTNAVQWFARHRAAAEAEAGAKEAALTAFVEKAEGVFRHYGDLHAAKPDMVKAEKNYAMADHARRILAALAKPPSEGASDA